MGLENNKWRVQRGDCLWKIAASVYHNGNRWREIASANGLPTSGNPIIYPGQLFILPGITPGSQSNSPAPAPVVESAPAPEVEQPKKKTIKVTYVQEELAVAYIPVALDEKQAVLLEQDLLERDPELKKGEAKFYARHCTKGKKYTIAQYKKSLRCAYETARTSMDHLAELLYYRKEKIKNKYVYIPVERE